MTSITAPTRPPAKRDALRVAVRQRRFQRVVPARLVFLLAMLTLILGSVSVAHAQTTAPTVSTVAVTSDPGTDETYALGDTIEVGLTFSEAVTVTGTPYLLIDVGGTNRRADYDSGSGATVPMPDDSLIPGKKVQEIPLNGSVVSSVNGSPLDGTRTNT